jgi:hypothetical protein
MLEPRIGATDHFWYRLQPEGLYIDSQRGHRAFAYTRDRLLLSEDNGRTWPHCLAFADAPQISFSCLLGNGNVVFATAARLFVSTDNLASCREVRVLDLDGQPYLPHHPTNPDLPGWYYHTLSGINSWDVNGTEMLVWGNYCNVVGGAAPVNIYYSVDGGLTVKLAYAFGQSRYWRDDGTSGGGSSGALLGNAANHVCCRHVHTVAYNPMENAFWACTGDRDTPEGFECHWLRGTYDRVNDAWDWQVVVSDHLNSRYKAGGISFVDGRLYWISDSNGPEPYDRGIFSCAPGDLARPQAHTLHYNPGVESGNMIIEGDVILASHCAPASPLATGLIISTDAGRTWAEYDLQDCGPRSPTRFHPMNGEGWFRMDLRAGWIERAEVLFVKPKLG